MSSKIFLISGPPGAGKSTLAKAIAKRFNKSIHIECDSLYNMVQGGYKKPWENEADSLLSLMYEVLVLQAELYLRAGFVVISDYVWSPHELYFLLSKIKPNTLFYPIFLLPKKAINLERDRNREYGVGLDRVTTYWESFAEWRYQIPQVFYDNSNLLASEMAQNMVKEQGLSYDDLKLLFSL